MRILGIETSCDETSASIVEDGRKPLSNLIASQVDIHARFGGIVPEVASRQHLLQIAPMLEQALSEARCTLDDVDAVAVTIGPGLAGSLLVGVNFAKAIAFARGLPLVGVNHLEGHIYANWLWEETLKEEPALPAVALIASGGHTDLVLIKGHGDFTLLGRTRDDAAGEAFDKAARILGLGYPGGPAIQRVTATVDGRGVRLPRAWLEGSYDFSFSGVKTAVLHEAREKGIYPAILQKDEAFREEMAEPITMLAAGFQESVVDVLVTKTIDAARHFGAKEILLAGGVAANSCLRKTLAERSPLPFRYPKPILCTDNAAMIASCGFFRYQLGVRSGWDTDVVPNLRVG